MTVFFEIAPYRSHIFQFLKHKQTAMTPKRHPYQTDMETYWSQLSDVHSNIVQNEQKSREHRGQELNQGSDATKREQLVYMSFMKNSI